MNHIGLSYFDATYPEREDVVRLSPPLVGSFMEFCRSISDTAPVNIRVLQPKRTNYFMIAAARTP
jgi:hypothetical protein